MAELTEFEREVLERIKSLEWVVAQLEEKVYECG